MKRVLVLNSYHSGYVWGDTVNDGIRSMMSGSGMNVNIRYEFMDTKHLRPEVIFERLREMYALKYSRFQFDVIIATDNNALNFLLLYRDELFPGTPVVFCGINGYSDELLSGAKLFTGFAENSDMRGTLDIALKIHPETQHVALVSGTSTSSIINQRRMKEIFPEYADRVDLIDLSMLNPEVLAARLQKLPENTIILYLSYYKMKDGTFLTVRESTSFVHDNSGLPMYSPWEYTMGHGMVGGMMLSGAKEGERAASYALKLLNGTEITDLPIVYESDIQPVFDYEILQHFNISSKRLPPNSLIRNEPQTVYFKYKYWIWALVIFVCYQTVTIIWLSHNLIRRKKAEKQQKNLEDQLLHAQKMEAIGTFAGGIAHDLNNILGAIGTCSEIALEDTPPSDPVYEDLEHVLSATNRGKSLIRQILDFSRKRELDRKPLNMKEMVEECMKLLRQMIPPTIDIQVRISTHSSIVLANPAKIHQLVINLCTNAEQAMRGKNGTLAISLDRVVIGEDNKKLPELKAGPHVLLQVSDTGCGMSKELQTRIFEPFFTSRAKTEGTGLGLAVVHGIVTGYGGAIFIESELEVGSTFSVYLPCRSEENLLPIGDKHEVVPGGVEHLLLVDDDEDLLYSGRKILERAGYTVTSCSGSLEALEVFSPDPEKFDLLVTDQVMPKMTGLDLILQIREIRRTLPVLLCSGHTDENISKESLQENGIDCFLSKPFTANDLQRTVRQVLDKNVKKDQPDIV